MLSPMTDNYINIYIHQKMIGLPKSHTISVENERERVCARGKESVCVYERRIVVED